MINNSILPPVRVKVRNFSNLFGKSKFPIAVDTYQRGFVWNDEKIRQLADDLADYQRIPDPKPPYYMGTVLVHSHAEKKKHFIIDGQQRLTALCVLHQQLKSNLPDNCALTYSPQSARRIRNAAGFFRDYSNRPNADIFQQIVFTVISVDRVDLAFTFFDTQNNRGVPLHATDLFKAYHLRAVDGATTERKEALQRLCAQRWESIQKGKPVMSHDQEFASSLFTKFLWRARYWTGSRVVYGGHDALMEEFQKQTWTIEGDHSTIPLYQSRHNRLGTALTLTRDGHSEIHTNRISLSPNAEDLPFAIRQPIHKGIGFFLYADKYSALLRCMVREPTDAPEVLHFREVYQKLMMANSLFLREVFLLASLMYFDQFGDEKLWEFSLWLEHALGAIRLDKQQVRYEAAQNFVKQDPNNPGNLNLLDVIATSFRPEQIISHLKTHHAHRDSYTGELIETGKGVQGNYKQAVLTYFDQTESTSLGRKDVWIAAKLKVGAA
ncbi:MAG TPA: DUF262 domain-containing protein [Methylotenera sp.]